MTSSSLMWGVVFGAVGMGYCVYGKKQQAVVPLLCGLGLIAVPYFVANAWALVALCALLMALPFVYRP